MPAKHPSLADTLLRAAVAFAESLRQASLPVGLNRTIEFLRALDAVNPGHQQEFYWAARLTLCSRREDIAIFDEAFAAFWKQGNPVLRWRRPSSRDRMPAGDALPPLASIAKAQAAPRVIPVDEETPSTKEGDHNPPETLGVFRYSPQEVLKHKDFGTYTEEEFETAQRLMVTLRVSVPLRRSRRLAPARRGRLALESTLRRAFRTDGELLRWSFQAPKSKPRRLVFLCDISGSMSQYSRALLLFLHTAARARRGVEAFCFGTRLTRVTRELSSGGPEETFGRAAAAVVDWSGGTRLGQCLKEFCDRWGQRGFARGAVVVIISDGWDRGDPALLAEQMARLRRLAYRLIWVNPCKGAPDYEPLTLGMSTAMPYIDDFLAGHNLASLESLAVVIGEAFERPGLRGLATTHGCEKGTFDLRQAQGDHRPGAEPELAGGR